MPIQVFASSEIKWNDVEMEIFFPKVDLRFLLSFVFIPRDYGFGFVTLFEKVISKCCHHQRPVDECEDSTNFCLVIVGPTDVEPKHSTKFVLLAHFESLVAPTVDLYDFFSKRFHRFRFS